MIAALLTSFVCSISGSGEMLLPDSRCTPGAWHNVPARKVRARACTPNKPRAYIPIGLKRQILSNYGMTEESFEGKWDHRFPHWALGTDGASNIWPYSGKQPYPKDVLETYARRRYCEKKNLRMATIRKWFKGDWRSVYKRYVKRGDIKPA
jgi:hypothetical protein